MKLAEFPLFTSCHSDSFLNDVLDTKQLFSLTFKGNFTFSQPNHSGHEKIHSIVSYWNQLVCLFFVFMHRANHVQTWSWIWFCLQLALNYWATAYEKPAWNNSSSSRHLQQKDKSLTQRPTWNASQICCPYCTKETKENSTQMLNLASLLRKYFFFQVQFYSGSAFSTVQHNAVSQKCYIVFLH